MQELCYNLKMKKNLIYILLAVLIFILAGYFLIHSNAKAPEADTNKTGITYDRASPDLIQVGLPFPGAVVGKEFSVIGKARGNWYFEASFPITVRDKDGKTLAQTYATAQGEWMTSEFVPFKSEPIKIPESYIGPATLVLHKDNASGLPEHDASISFPITIEY